MEIVFTFDRGLGTEKEQAGALKFYIQSFRGNNNLSIIFKFQNGLGSDVET